eukprot:8380553-Pyramimonas_sp.AAC.1
MAGSSAPNRLSDLTPVICRGPSGAAAASPAGGIVTKRTSVIACSCALLKRSWGDFSSAVPSKMLLYTCSDFSMVGRLSSGVRPDPMLSPPSCFNGAM